MSSQTMLDEKVKVKRPSKSDKEVVEKAVESIINDVLIWFSQSFDKTDEEEVADIKDQLVKAIESESDDAYKICKYLDDRFMWDADDSLVDIMGKVWISVDREYKKVLSSWIADNAIKPKFEIGSIVKFKPDGWKKDLSDGEITAVNMERGEYTVFCEALGHVKTGVGSHGRILKFEEVEELNVDVKETINI